MLLLEVSETSKGFCGQRLFGRAVLTHIGLRIYFPVDGVWEGTGEVTQARTLRGNSATMWGPHGAGAGISLSPEKFVFFLFKKAAFL